MTAAKELPAERYRALMDDSPIPTVDILFFDSELSKVLLGKRSQAPQKDNFYTLGGRLHKNEGLEAAAVRIAKQETGISISPETLVEGGVTNEIHPDSKFEGINYHALNVYFGCIIERSALVLDAQHTEAQWFPVDEAAIHPNIRTKIDTLLRIMHI